MTRPTVEKILEQCHFAKHSRFSLPVLTDADPLAVVMDLVAGFIRNDYGSLDQPRPRKVWLFVMEYLQECDMLEHTPYIPCRFCNQAIRPVIDDLLLSLYLEWYDSGYGAAELMAIHRCQACGGQLNAIRTKTYKGDIHTPEPGSIEGDDAWRDALLRASGL